MIQEELAQANVSSSRKTVMFAIFAAALTAVAFFLIAWNEDKSVNQRERLQLIKMTNSFVTAFSQNRGEGAPVPATFRRLGIEHFSSSGGTGTEQGDTTVRMPGRPGLELGITEEDPRLRRIINSFVDTPDALPHNEHRFEAQRLIGRTVYASVATAESCVSCHNEVLQQNVYEIGDVMGAYIVERDLTENLVSDLNYSVVWFFASLLIFWLLASRERNHNIKAIQLENRVHLKEMKNAAAEKEKFLLSHDTLTGLPNRKLFNDYLAKAMSGGMNANLNAALIDLDEFKAVNDTMGHAAGDALLVEVASRLEDALRHLDGIVARLGGDEFALVWMTVGCSSEAEFVAKDILKVMAAPLEFEQWEIRPKCSIGIATWGNTGSGDPSDFLKCADAALYVAKGRGKNTYQLYDQAIDASIHRKNDMASQLPHSIDEGELRIVMQPKVLLRDGSFKGFETLSRWRFNGEEISPEEFVKVAESTGSVQSLDLQILREAALFSTQMERETAVEVPFSVNLSAKSFCSGTLLEGIQDVLFETGLPPARLTLEITETAAIENWKLVQTVLSSLREFGVRTSLDDFGTGYSSLVYLLRMKFDEIKIDREFVRDIEPENENHKLLRHLSEMAESLGIDLVIEGIETAQQVELIRGNPRHVGQGFYFSKPLEMDEAKEFILNAVTARTGQQKLDDTGS